MLSNLGYWSVAMADWIINNGRTIELVIMLIVIAFSFGLYLGITMSKCEDCKHFEQTTEKTGICDARSDNWFDIYVLKDDDAPCDKFEPYDDSWESVSK